MTTLYRKELKCQNCGESSEYSGLNSTNQFGSVDLDTRPPEMARSTLHVQIQCCPACGYCATDISQPTIDLSALVASREYQDQLKNGVYPDLAGKFLCRAILAESVGTYSEAGWAALKAAWVCDDARKTSAARTARKRAIALWIRALAAGQRFAEQAGAEEAMLVDLLRRSELFEEAMKRTEAASSQNLEEILRRILEFQRNLIMVQDARCYTVADALKDH